MSTLAVCAAAVISAGCTSFTSRPLVPADELNQLRAIDLGAVKIEYSRADAQPTDAPRPFDPRDGLDEAELVAVALAINPELRARRAEIGETQALLVTAGMLPNPDLGMFLRPGIDGASGVAFGLDLLFELLRPDARPAKLAVAQARLEIVRAEIESEELRVASAVRHARISVLAAEQASRLLQQEAGLRDDAVALVRRQLDLGEATEITLSLVELDRTSVQRQLRDSRATIEHERAALHALLGVPASLDLGLVGSGADLTFTIHDALSDDEIDERLLAGRSDLRARSLDYELSEQELRLAISGQYPSIVLGPSFEKDTDGNSTLGLAASVELPIFDRNQGDIAARTAARDRSRAEYVATLHTLRSRAQESRAQAVRARAELELQQQDVLPLVERTESLFEGALRAREISIFEWLVARTRAIQARRDLLDALARYANAVIDLDAATGMPLVSVIEAHVGEHSLQ